MSAEMVPEMSGRELTFRRALRYGLRIATLCAVSGLLLGLTVHENSSAQGSYPARSYVAALLAIIGVAGGGAMVVISFIMNAVYVGRRVREPKEHPPGCRSRTALASKCLCSNER